MTNPKKTAAVTLASVTAIPFAKLELSQSNVRRVAAGQSIEDLAEDIAHRGLLQSLSVRPVLDAAGQETGRYEVPAGGHFVAPTVLTDVSPTSDIVREEIFGPVAAIQTFTDEDDVIKRANDTEYGLAAYFFTTDFSRAMRVSEKLEYGLVGVNAGVISNAAAPFGGVKASGFGREGGFDGIDEYLETKYVGMTI